MPKKSKITIEDYRNPDFRNMKLKSGQTIQQLMDDINYHEQQIQSVMGMPSRLHMADEAGKVILDYNKIERIRLNPFKGTHFRFTKTTRRKLSEWYLDRKTWFKSLFTQKPVHRKYDDWYYRKGKLVSSWQLYLEISGEKSALRFAKPNPNTTITGFHWHVK